MCVLSLLCPKRAHLTQGTGERQSAQKSSRLKAEVFGTPSPDLQPSTLMSRQSRFSRPSRRLGTLTAYQRCVIPTALATDWALPHNTLVMHVAL